MTDYSFTKRGKITHGIIKNNFYISVETDNHILMSFLDKKIDELIVKFCHEKNYVREDD